MFVGCYDHLVEIGKAVLIHERRLRHGKYRDGLLGSCIANLSRWTHRCMLSYVGAKVLGLLGNNSLIPFFEQVFP
jgi:hypothetical protein